MPIAWKKGRSKSEDVKATTATASTNGTTNKDSANGEPEKPKIPSRSKTMDVSPSMSKKATADASAPKINFKDGVDSKVHAKEAPDEPVQNGTRDVSATSVLKASSKDVTQGTLKTAPNNNTKTPKDNTEPSTPMSRRARIKKRFSRSGSKDVASTPLSEQPSESLYKMPAKQLPQQPSQQSSKSPAKPPSKQPSRQPTKNGRVRFASTDDGTKASNKDHISARNIKDSSTKGSDKDSLTNGGSNPGVPKDTQSPAGKALPIEAPQPSANGNASSTNCPNGTTGQQPTLIAAPVAVIQHSAAARVSASTRDLLSATTLSGQGRPLPLTRYPELSMLSSLSEDKILTIERQHIKRLFIAVGTEDTPVLASLLSSGLVSPDVFSAGGITPLVYASAHGLINSTEVLIFHSADVNLMANAAFAAFAPAEVAAASKLKDGMAFSEPRTALMAAAAAGRLRVVKLLLLAGADDSIIAPDGQIALRLACVNGHTHVAKILPALNAGAAQRVKYKLAQAVVHYEDAVRFLQLVLWITLLLATWGWTTLLILTGLEESWARFCHRAREDLVLLRQGWMWCCNTMGQGVKWCKLHWPQMLGYLEDVSWIATTQPFHATLCLLVYIVKHLVEIAPLLWTWVLVQYYLLPRRVETFKRRAPVVIKNALIAVEEAITERFEWTCATLENLPDHCFRAKSTIGLRWQMALYQLSWLTILFGRLVTDAVERFKALPPALCLYASWAFYTVVHPAIALGIALAKAVSLVHSSTLALVTWFKAVTLADLKLGLLDLGNGLIDLTLLAIIRVIMFLQTCAVVVFKALGRTGAAVYWIVRLGISAVGFIPRCIWFAGVKGAEAGGQALQEGRVWWNPKAT